MPTWVQYQADVYAQASRREEAWTSPASIRLRIKIFAQACAGSLQVHMPRLASAQVLLHACRI